MEEELLADLIPSLNGFRDKSNAFLDCLFHGIGKMARASSRADAP
jgi:hypothetical protein